MLLLGWCGEVCFLRGREGGTEAWDGSSEGSVEETVCKERVVLLEKSSIWRPKVFYSSSRASGSGCGL